MLWKLYKLSNLSYITIPGSAGFALTSKKERGFSMQLIVRQKDIFTEPDQIPIAHVVAADDNLGAGFAKELKHQYPKYAYEFFAKKVHKTNSIEANQIENRLIYSLVIKHHYASKPTHQQLINILKKLKLRMPTDHQKVIAMPTICCGLDRQNFGKTKKQALHNIKKIIKEIFDDTDLTIIIDKL